MPKRDEAFMQQQRERILNGAYQCFLRKGFRSTSIRDICKEAGLSVGAVYIHFENREAIIEAVCKRVNQQTSESLMAGETAAEFIDNVADLISDGRKDPSLVNLNHQLLADAFTTDQMEELYSDLMNASFSMMKKHLKRFRDNGEIEMPFDLDTTAVGVASLLTGISLRMNFDDSRPENKSRRQIKKLVALMIGAPEVASRKRNLRQAG